MSKPTVQVVHYDGKKEKEQCSLYLNCKQCLDELPQGQSPREFKRLDVGLTKDGLQVWCTRHNVNVDRMEWRVHPDAKATGFEHTVSLAEVDKALAELHSMGIGTTLDRPAAILHALRRAVRRATKTNGAQ